MLGKTILKSVFMTLLALAGAWVTLALAYTAISKEPLYISVGNLSLLIETNYTFAGIFVIPGVIFLFFAYAAIKGCVRQIKTLKQGSCD
ncbi:MAG: hypothetical protein HYT27_02085 [Parcubacteria group bacterium]|nr:hypothetical protein [Parcubacteria group bacterium]